MKKYYILAFILASVLTANAQFREKTLIYGSFEASYGNYKGVDFNLNYVHDNKYSIKVGYSGFLRRAKNAPDDFVGTFFDANDVINSIHLVYGRIFILDKKKQVHLNFGAGLAYVGVDIPQKFDFTGLGFFLTNYKWDHAFYNEIGFVINPKIEYLLTRYLGVSASPLFQYSKHSSYIGVGVGVLFNIIHKRRNH